MDLYLTPAIVSSFVYALGLGMAVGYLAVSRDKSADTKLVMTLLVLWLAVVSLQAGYDATHTNRLLSGPGFNRNPGMTSLLMVLQLGVVASLGLVVYRVGFVFARRESILFLAVVGGYVLWSLIVMALNWDSPGPRVAANRQGTVVVVASSIWLFVTSVRKRIKAGSMNAELSVRRLVMMGLIATVCVVIYYVTATNAITFVPLSAELRAILPALSTVAVEGALILGTLLYADEKHWLPVKLAGFLVIAYVAFVTIVIPMTRTELGLRREFATPHRRSSLVFEPTPDGGYVERAVPPRWIEPSGTSHYVADDAAVEVRSRFRLPMYGASYDSVWIGTNGSVSFGAEIDADETYSEGQSFFDPIPSAMPFYSDFVMVTGSAELLVDVTDERLVATWDRMALLELVESKATFQAAFYPDGRIEFNYGNFNSIPLNGIVGISPGGPASPTGIPEGPTVVPAGQPLFEQWNDRTAYRRFVHEQIVPVAWIAILGLFVVLVGGLLFYRAGLLEPLDRVLSGLRAVEAGNLDVEVTIRERNELGALADHFNLMTAALKTYSSRMEDLVDQRTADLDRTIRDLKATQAQLVEQEKLASLGSLTAGIAHEIKNPLNFVNNFAEVNCELAEEARSALAAGDLEGARQALADMEENAAQIAKHGKRADSIVRSMMQHARGGASERETIDVNVFLEEYAALAWHGMRARDDGFNAALVRDFDGAAGSIQAMPQELGRVILNLLNNAFDAVRGVENARVTITSCRTPKSVEIEVADNGPGISPEIREKIFEPFFTTKPTGEGTGLGLSLSYDIVTIGHGGTMTVAESPEGGAAFRVTLPI